MGTESGSSHTQVFPLLLGTLPTPQLGPHTVMSLFCSSGLVMMYTWTVSNSSREMKSSGTCGRE